MSKNISPPEILTGGGTSKRIGYIDALKGFAIICVVIGHVADGYFSAGMYPESSTFIYSVYNIVYAFHMPLFMMISGFVFCTAYVREGIPNAKRIHRQILNLVAVYLIFSISFGLFKVAVGKYTNKPVSLMDVAMIWAKPIAPYWYLYVLIFLYLIFSVERLYKINKYIMISLLTVLALISQLFYLPYFQINSMLYYAIFFYIGLLHSLSDDKIIGNKVLAVIMLCASVALSAVLWNKENDMEKILSKNFAASIVIALGVSLAIWYLFENIKALGSNRFLQTIGRYSLEIYVIHCVFTAGFRIIIPRLGIENVYLSFLLNTIISTAIPIGFSFVCKKLNIHGLFFKPVTYIKNLKNGIKGKNC